MAEAPASDVRADAARNRAGILAAATRAFAAAETEPSMRAVAREAGVGIATLYRHFPTREALVDAVYRDQVGRLTRGARDLTNRLDPVAALREWMDLFGEWVRAKHGMVETLRAMSDAGAISHTATRDKLRDAITHLLAAGAASGDLRTDVPADDVAAALLGILTVADAAQADRLLDLLVDGLRRGGR